MSVLELQLWVQDPQILNEKNKDISMLIVAEVIHRIIQLFILVVVIQTFLSYFMSPYEPIRRVIDRIVDPFLSPIRRVIPQVGMFDFSPLVLIILLYLLDAVIMRIFVSFS